MTAGSSYQKRVLEVRKNPDFERFRTVLQRKTPERAVLYEFYIHPPVADILLGRPFPEYSEKSAEYQLAIVEAYLNGGYDYAPLIPSTFGFRLPIREQKHAATVSMNDGVMVSTLDEVSQLTWLDGKKCDASMLARVADGLPKGMKFVVCAPSGVLENSMRMLGFENFCMLAADGDPLVQAVVDHVGQSILSFYEFCLQSGAVGAIMVNDDWGYRTGPMLSPDMLRSLIMPWHRRFVMAANARGCPALLHSCGNLEVVMEDIITDLGFAAKHSFEDTILPVEDAWKRWGSRIAILGGIDLDFVCRESPEKVYERCREIVEMTQCKGYALGTGNQIARYAPVEQSFAMLAAAIDTWE